MITLRPSQTVYDMAPLDTASKLVLLKDATSGLYLHQSGLLRTGDKTYRWKGTIQQAKAMRKAFPLAEGLTIVTVRSTQPSKDTR